MTEANAFASKAARLSSALSQYYERYYRRDLGLPNWKELIEKRLVEETHYGAPMLKWLSNWTGLKFSGMRVLVVGAGTGAETLSFVKEGAIVTAVEPFAEAIEILSFRVAAAAPQPTFNIVSATAEHLPFDDCSFDLVYCYTVLEHTIDPKRCLDEMLRVVTFSGTIFVETPDYRFPYDSHYKIPWIPFSPRVLIYLYLRLRARPTAFARTLRYVSFSLIRRHLNDRNAYFLRFFPPLPNTWKKRGLFWRSAWFFSYWSGIIPNQFLLIRKSNPFG